MEGYEMGERGEEKIVPRTPEREKEKFIMFVMLCGATREEAEDFAACFAFENERTERGEE